MKQAWDQKAYYLKNRDRLLQQKREYQKANREKINEKNRSYYRRNEKFRKNQQERMRKYKRAWRLGKVYGITEDEYQDMLDRQSGVCAICKSGDWGKKGSPHIDHDHLSGKVRGILCQTCNQAIGLMGDSTEKLMAAIKYLTPKNN